VPLAEERDQQLFNDLILADDDAAQLFFDVIEGVAQAADGFEILVAHFGFQGGSVRRIVHRFSFAD
jgi:hypothetical protein